MTVLRSVASQQYTPQTVSARINVPQSATRMSITLTRENWPVGPVGALSVFYPDGTLAASQSFDGGPNPVHPFTGVEQTKQIITVRGPVVNGVPTDLPKGQFQFDAEILQTLTTSILIERF